MGKKFRWLVYLSYSGMIGGGFGIVVDVLADALRSPAMTDDPAFLWRFAMSAAMFFLSAILRAVLAIEENTRPA
ncbi:MAG: hypothetical protein ISP45_00160 [Reyranella sp.]|nr:hypothetical protein [Reyranella sp.]